MVLRLHEGARVGALLTLCAVLATGCARCSGEDPEVPAGAKPAAAVAAATAEPAEVPAHKAIYKSALERARKEISADNAARRLEDLDGQIEREREMMR
jgi:hypothetical protein